MPIYRVQDRHGRGPWRPGFSDRWVDAWRTEGLPPVYVERPDFAAVVRSAHARGLHIGCAVRGLEGLRAWFSQTELLRLLDMGFHVADASGCEVILETPTQVVIGSRQSLRRLPLLSVVAS